MSFVGIYVIQVVGGREAKAVECIVAMTQDAVQDCFVPQREVMKRIDGEWRKTTERLFPGYVFVQAENPMKVRRALRAVPAFTRMLASAGDTFQPLTHEEVAWLHVHTDVKTHIVEMSKGIIEGDRVVVISGPLKGQEANIAHIDRHKRRAWVDIDVFGRHKTVQVGLEIVSKRAIAQ